MAENKEEKNIEINDVGVSPPEGTGEVPVVLENPEEITPASKPVNEKTLTDQIKDTYDSFSVSVVFLRPLSILAFIISLVGSFYLASDLDPENKYLALFGVSENTQKKYTRFIEQERKLKIENKKLKSSNEDLKKRLDNKNFFTQQSAVDMINGDKLDWVDKRNSEGDIVYGMINSVGRITTYFNSLRYQHPILYAGNDVKIDEISIDRKTANFNVVLSNIFGKAFFLSTELVDIMNSFPVFKGGDIKNFSKKLNKEGDYEMQFSLKLNIQFPNEKDNDDYRFQEYISWLSGER